MGGLSRTVNYKGNRIDIGGHRFFSKSDRERTMYAVLFFFLFVPVGADSESISPGLSTAGIRVFDVFRQAPTPVHFHGRYHSDCSDVFSLLQELGSFRYLFKQHLVGNEYGWDHVAPINSGRGYDTD